MLFDQFLVSLLIFRVACDVIGDLEVRQDGKCVQTALLLPERVVIQRFGIENRPAGRFAIFIDETPVILHQVVGDAPHHTPNRLFFAFVGDQVIINRPDEVVPIQFVGAGVAFPDIVWVDRRLVPLPLD
jgi:hypothetical protein